MLVQRRSHFDVTNTVWIAHPGSVCDAVCALLSPLYPVADLAPLRESFRVFADLYAGEQPGYVGNETWYHDAQHSLDTALAMARLLDGHERGCAEADRLGAERCVVGVIAALFHDAGYIRRTDDRESHGAELTVFHVRRSGELLAALLPQWGLGAWADLVEQIVHYTGYEKPLEQIPVSDSKDRRLGFLLGTADLLAQMADRCFLEKCRDFLYAEYEICGLAGAPKPAGPVPLFSSPEDLLRKIPELNRKIWVERLDGHFRGAHRHLEQHFRGRNPYLGTIRAHLARLLELLDAGRLNGLQRRPEAVNAPRLRQILGLDRDRVRVPTPRFALAMPHLALRVSMAENRRLLPT